MPPTDATDGRAGSAHGADRSKRKLAGAYPSSLRAFTRLVEVQRALFEGIWLGALDVDDLYAVDDWYYGGAAAYADERHVNRGLFDWETTMVRDHVAAGARILVSAVGGGRELLALAALGHEVHGFECNRALFGVATRHIEGCENASVEWMDRGEWPTCSRPFDAAVLGWGSYTLGPTVADRVAMLRSAATRVSPGAPVLFSFLATDHHGRADRLIARLAGLIRRLRRRPPAVVGDHMAPNFVHVFTRDQIEREVALAGLELAAFSTESYGHAVALVPPRGRLEPVPTTPRGRTVEP